MEKFSHTPGPWEIKEGDTLIIANAVDTQDDYDYLMVAGVVGLPDDPVALANLALIAAAPELLEALREVLRVVDELYREHEIELQDEDVETVQFARAAIAMAMGDKS